MPLLHVLMFLLLLVHRDRPQSIWQTRVDNLNLSKRRSFPERRLCHYWPIPQRELVLCSNISPIKLPLRYRRLLFARQNN